MPKEKETTSSDFTPANERSRRANPAFADRPLNEEDKQTNRLRSRIRCRVEHVYGRLEHMRANVVRTIGIQSAAIQIGLANLVYNLDRYALLRRQAGQG